MNALPPNPLSPKVALIAAPAEIARFVSSLFLYADEGTFISLRAFDQKDRGKPPVLIEGIRIGTDLDAVSLRAAHAATIAANADNAAVFAPPVATFDNPRTARTVDVANGVAISVELDTGDPDIARRKLESILGPVTLAVHSGGEWADPNTGEIHPKTHFHWRLSEPTATQEDHAKLQETRWLAAVLVGGDKTAAPPAHPLRWAGSWNLKSLPRLARIAAGNQASEVHLDDALSKLAEAVEASGLNLPANGPRISAEPEASLEQITAALAAIPNANVEWDEWNRLGMAAWRASGGSPAGLEAWSAWSAKSDKNDPAACEARWAHFGTSPPTLIGAGTIFHMARVAGWQRPTTVQNSSSPPGHRESSRPQPASAPIVSEPLLDPWNALQPPTFPIECLPDVLRRFVEGRALALGADPCAIAWAAISACSSALDGRIRLKMKRHDHWSVPPHIWVALVGRVSAKKTPVIDAAWAPLQRAQTQDLNVWQEELARWRSLLKNERGDQPVPRRRLVTHDSTPEALQDILSRQDRGIGVLRDELAGWIGSLEKYSTGRGGAADRAFFLQAFNGGPHVVDRVGRGTVSINNLALTLCGGIQPDRLRQFGDLTDDGLWQRFIPVVMHPASLGTDTAGGEAPKEYEELIRRLLLVEPRMHAELCDAARDVREDVEHRAHELERSEAISAGFAGFCGKLHGLWGRLALVISQMETGGFPSIVSLQAAEAARTLICDSALPNAARVYTEMGGAGGNLDATRSIAGFILTKRKNRLLASDLTANVRVCRGQPLDAVQRLLSPLIAGGWLTPEQDYAPTAWGVNVAVHERFALRAQQEAARRQTTRALIAGTRQIPDNPDCAHETEEHEE